MTPATWTEPGVRHLAANGLGGEAYRTSPLDDQWELYDLTDDPTEAVNRWGDPELDELRRHLQDAAEAGTHRCRSRAEQSVALRVSPAGEEASANVRAPVHAVMSGTGAQAMQLSGRPPL